MALSLVSLRTAVRTGIEGAEPRSRAYTTYLTNAPGASGTTFSVADGDAWQVGDILEGESEQCLVTAISTNDLTVVRDHGGSTETFVSGQQVRKNPRFTAEMIDEAIDQILLELNPRVYHLTTENIAVTTDDWYDTTDTAMEEVFSVWYVDDGDFHVPFFYFQEDPANAQPKVFIAARGYSGNVHVNYRRPYAAVTEMPDRLKPMMVAGAVYKLMGIAGVLSTTDPGKRTDRTVQGGQEFRDSYWFYREFQRLRDNEVAYLADKVANLPKDRVSQRARRYRV